MNLLDRPFFRSQSGETFLWMQMFPAFFLFIATWMWVDDLPGNPMNPVWMAIASEILFYVLMVVHYRIWKRFDER